MAMRADFTEDEWEALQKGVTGAGMLVSISDRDFTDTFGEAGALARTLASAGQRSDSELVRELASSKQSGFGLTASPQKVEKETLASLAAALDALGARAPDEAGAYRQLVVDVAEAVAAAKGGVTDVEKGMLDRIRQAVGEA